MADCDVCGGVLPAQTGRGGRRKRHADCRKPRPRNAPPRAASGRIRSLVAAVTAEVKAMDAATTALGRGAIELATAIEAAGVEQSAAKATLHKELRATLEELRRSAAPAEDDPVERAQRDLRVVS